MAYFPDQLRKCVAFVGSKDESGKYHFAGSGFWVARDGPANIKDTYRPVYFVTANHVIKKVREKSADNRVWLRVNIKNQGQDWIETPQVCWGIHPTHSTVDLAILKMGIDPRLGHIAWPLRSSVVKDMLDSHSRVNRKESYG